MNFDTNEYQQIDVTELVRLFDSSELDPNEFIEAESRGFLSRLRSLAFTSNWILSPLALTTVKNRLYVWEGLNPSDLHTADIISDADARIGLLQSVAKEFWRIEQYWMNTPVFVCKYGSPLEMMKGEGVTHRRAWVFGLYLKDDQVFLDFQYED